MRSLTFLLGLSFFLVVSLSLPGFSQDKNFQVVELQPGIFEHISYLETASFGRVDCNGLVVVSNGEALIIDAPVSEVDAQKLMDYIQKELKCKIVGVVATHFHEDAVGGLTTFHRASITSYGNILTQKLASEAKNPVPEIGFQGFSSLAVGKKRVIFDFFGEGHTRDNIVGYVLEDDVLFGGCLIKAKGASKGNLADANVEAWPATVTNIIERFPDVKLVIPGHGAVGDKGLLTYTVQLFEKP